MENGSVPQTQKLKTYLNEICSNLFYQEKVQRPPICGALSIISQLARAQADREIPSDLGRYV